MTDVTVETGNGNVTVNLGTNGAVAGASTLTTLNRLVKVTATGTIGMATIAESGITGVLTLTKTGTTARTVTFPDAAITVARIDAAQTFTGQSTFTDGIFSPHVDAATSAGLHIGNATHQDVAIFGAGGGQGSTFYGQINGTSLALSSGITCTTMTASGDIFTHQGNGRIGLTDGNTAGGNKLQSFNAAGTGDGYIAFEGYTQEYGRILASGVLAWSNTTASTSTTTGCATFAGGIGVAGAGYFGGGIACTTLSITSADYIYLRGNATTDGAVRMSSQASGTVSFESRTSGTWNVIGSFA